MRAWLCGYILSETIKHMLTRLALQSLRRGPPSWVKILGALGSSFANFFMDAEHAFSR